MTSAEKLEVARALAKLGVDVMEAGFPAASPDDLEAVRRIAVEVGNSPDDGRVPVICGLARSTQSDIDKAWQAVKEARFPRIHTFLATSPIHMKYKLKMEPAEVIQKAAEMVAYARSLCPDVEFSPEDAGRSDPDFLYKVLGAAIAAGATTLNIPDTVGYTTPDEFGALIAGIIKHTPGMHHGIVISVHCHNDLGLATANTLAGIRNGARQAEVTINGIGERAGNTALEEVVMALRTRNTVFSCSTGIDASQITRVSKLVSNYTGMVVQPNKAIVGANAFAHESGIHQDGMLKHAETYEIMEPETVGLSRSKLVLGKHSGRHALKVHLQELGYELSPEHLQKAFDRFKDIADKKKTVTNADLEALVEDQILQNDELYRLDALQVSCGTTGLPTASVRIIGPEQNRHTKVAGGTGPVDAVFKAIDQIIHVKSTLLEYNVHAVTKGIDALGEVTVRVQADNGNAKTMTDPQTSDAKFRTFGGYGADTDIIVASAKAYIAALNKLLLSTYPHEEDEQASIQLSPNQGPVSEKKHESSHKEQ